MSLQPRGQASSLPLPPISISIHLPGVHRVNLKVFGEQLAKWLGHTVTAIVWEEWVIGRRKKRCLSVFFIFPLPPFCLSPRLAVYIVERVGYSSSSISSPVTASIAVTLKPPRYHWSTYGPVTHLGQGRGREGGGAPKGGMERAEGRYVEALGGGRWGRSLRSWRLREKTKIKGEVVRNAKELEYSGATENGV